jgi:RsiW-degrading membrane proteinase PrsW (M82 family)
VKKSPGFIRSRWFQILVIGIVLFIITEQALKLTQNLNLVPTVLLLGAFIVPLTFVAYFYGQERVIDRDIHQQQSPLTMAGLCFLIGGALGVAAAATLEYATLQHTSLLEMFGVGLIEEIVKLILPLIIFIRWRYHSEADGLLFGVASGMGFAALETMGYGLTTLIASGGDIGTFEEVLLIRGLLAPAGHAAWTGFVCAVLWRERNRKGRKVINVTVVGAFIIAVALHSLWNIISSLAGPTVIQFVIVITSNLAIAAVSLILLFRRLRESQQLHAEQSS